MVVEVYPSFLTHQNPFVFQEGNELVINLLLVTLQIELRFDGGVSGGSASLHTKALQFQLTLEGEETEGLNLFGSVRDDCFRLHDKLVV